MSDRVPLYVLAGGRSSRFGSNKARAEVEGLPLIQHVIRALEPLASRVTVVAREQGQYADLGLHTIGDLQPELGPMGGLATALADLHLTPDEPWLLLAPCDLLGLRRQWLQELLARPRQEHLVVAFRGSRWEPLPALYHRDVQPEVESRVAAGRRSIWRLVERCRPLALAPPPSWEAMRRVNRPEDLEQEDGPGR